MDMKVLTVLGPMNAEYSNVPAPAPEGDMIKIKVMRTGICATDFAIFTGDCSFVRSGEIVYPVRFGHEFSGIVTEVGENVKNFKVGDRVRILSGPFANVEGVVESMNDETEIATVLTIMFSQETPTDVSYIDLEKLD